MLLVNKKNEFRNFIILLIFLLSLPVFIISINTFLIAQEDQEIVSDVQNRQLQNLHFSINQQIKEIVLSYFPNAGRLIEERKNSFLLTWIKLDIEGKQMESLGAKYLVEKSLKLNKSLYNKKSMNQVIIRSLNDSLLVCRNNAKNELLIINKDIFLRNELLPVLFLNSNESIQLALKQSSINRIIYAKKEFDSSALYFEESLWIWPDVQLLIQISNNSLEELRLWKQTRSLVVISLLIILLTIAMLLFYNIYKKEKKLSRLKTDFVANVSHELKTPISLIRMNAETLEMGRVKEEKKNNYYRVIISETERLTHLINSILNFSKIDSGKKQFTFQAVDLNEKVEFVLAQYEILLDRNDFQRRIDLDSLIQHIYADPNDVIEIILNLLDNAIKYSKDEKRIQVRTYKKDKFVVLEMKDAGSGISEKDLPLIYEPFFRAENSLNQHTKGTGLGLSLVKEMVLACGGKIEVKSKLKEGTTFKIMFKTWSK